MCWGFKSYQKIDTYYLTVIEKHCSRRIGVLVLGMIIFQENSYIHGI